MFPTCGYDGGRGPRATDLGQEVRLVPVAVTDLAIRKNWKKFKILERLATELEATWSKRLDF